MIKKVPNQRILYLTLTLVLLTQGCMQVRSVAVPVSGEVIPTATAAQVEPSATPAPVTRTPIPTVTLIVPTDTPLPGVTVSAVKGNLFIRRGPGMAYNPIGLLSDGMSADVIAHDMLSKWAQVAIPNSDKTGWVSLMTSYSRVDGDLASMPGFTFTDWPVPAYLINCMDHNMYVLPGKLTVASILASPDNQIWLYPGTYTIYDYDLGGRPAVQMVEIREGETAHIVYDGLGNHRNNKCR